MPHNETAAERSARLRREALQNAAGTRGFAGAVEGALTPNVAKASIVPSIGRGEVGMDYATKMRAKGQKEASDKLVQEHIKRVGRGRTAPKEYTKARQGRAANIKYNDSGRQETTGPEIAKQKYGY